MFSSFRFSSGFWLSLFFFVSSTAIAAPKFELQGDSKIDLGAIDKGLKIQFETIVKNVGEHDLQINLAKLSCSSCTRYLGEDQAISISPGQSHAFAFEFDSAKKRGHFTNFLQFKTNDPEQKMVSVSFTGSITPILKLGKSMLRSNLVYGEKYSESVAVNLLNSRYQILDAKSSSDLLKVSLRKDPDVPKDVWLLDVRTKAAVTTTIRGNISIRYQQADDAPLSQALPFMLTVSPPVRAIPSRVQMKLEGREFNGLGRDQITSTTFVLEFDEALEGKYIDYRLSASLTEGLSLNLVPEQSGKGKEFNLVLSEIPLNSKLPASGTAFLKFEFDPDNFYELQVPIGIRASEPFHSSRRNLIFRKKNVILPNGETMSLSLKPIDSLKAEFLAMRVVPEHIGSLDIDCDAKDYNENKVLYITARWPKDKKITPARGTLEFDFLLNGNYKYTVKQRVYLR